MLDLSWARCCLGPIQALVAFSGCSRAFLTKSQLLALPISSPLCGTSWVLPQEDGDLVLLTAQQRFLITQRRCEAVP